MKIKKIITEFAKLPQVEAILLGGSKSTLHAEKDSDWDLYIYLTASLPIAKRFEIAKKFSDHFEINNLFWEPGDEWVLRNQNESIDIMFRSYHWIKEQLTSVVDRHEARIGYTTCFWFNLINSKILFDRRGRYKKLQIKYNVPYPNELKLNIVYKNYPILRQNISSYYKQIEKAIKRHDLVSINHRVSALLASYFDIVLAVNELPHPGEKRLVFYILNEAAMFPLNFKNDIYRILKHCDGRKKLLQDITHLLCNLDKFLEKNLSTFNLPIKIQHNKASRNSEK